LETHSAGGWINGRRLMSTFLLAPQAIGITSPGRFVRSHRILGFARARREIVGFN